MPLVTYKGTEFDYLNPTPEMIDIEDILRSLPRLNRFVGHSDRAYNVGEHIFHCLVMAEKLGLTYREQFLAFTHDFEEAYTGDCPAPLKKLIPEFSVIAERVSRVIYEHIGIAQPTEEEHLKVKRIDLTMLVIEMKKQTVHEWESYINEYTHIEMVDDDEFNLDEPFEEDNLRELLTILYGYLLKKVREEESNGNKV